jgi:transcriptional regulator with XRE-family HTH domain
MTAKNPSRPSWNALLSQALRILRRARLMKVRDVAAAMNLPPRTYEHFEAGGGQISLERIHQVAEVLKADGHAILASVMIGSPQFALRAADNRLMTAFLINLEEFDKAAGDDMSLLDPTDFMTAFADGFDGLLAKARTKAELKARFVSRLNPEASLSGPSDEG